MRRILLVSCVLFILSSTVVFAAGGEQQGESKLTVWITHGPPDNGILQKIVDGFNATNPTLKAEMHQVPGSETDSSTLMTAVRGGTGPDAYMLDRFVVPQRAADGILEDITDELLKIDPQIKNKYIPFAWDEANFKGRTYALPFDTDTRMLYYRKDILRAAGVDLTKFDPANGPLTLAELDAIAKTLDVKDANGNYTRLGWNPVDDAVGQVGPYTWGFIYGATFANASTMTIQVTDPKLAQTYQWAKEWAASRGPQQLSTWTSTYSPPNSPPQNQPFITGNLAILITGDWQINTMTTYAKDVEYGITWLPVAKAGDQPTTWAGGWSWVVPKGTKHKPEAVAFLAYAAGEPGQTVYTRDSLHLPTSVPVSQNASLFDAAHKIFQESLPVAHSRPVLPIGAYFWDSLYTAWKAVWFDQADVQTSLQQVQEQSQTQLNRFK
ncbi:MAG: ABC transporter substrate-binding protein [Treponema sp.]|jgi:multiple sugar transport system substrate-binding protein|nr:ABC transporter substrate-binding protein [Treponema sp.]